ncbi:hypothetical protein EW093_08375 [Thiospirochaeta perfilievii]|uniref:Uncharacterized protein n=1 Tax=Thiospirochaeta perfilievii TaxID=252967 RepID=A0A5C1QB23_9SPIO|nr:hypothetical protein [Thiospirochaeta perfilievii]QEN04721.1 hypothetical protein EW093_08375 [Thiospirochaeta perfilievii]
MINLFISSLCFSQDFHTFKNGLSMGNVSFSYSQNGGISSLDLFSFRIIESNTGLGLTTYIYPVFMNENVNSTDLFSMELNWEPLFDHSSFWGTGLFLRLDNYLPYGREIDYRTGVRFELRQPFGDFIYPLLGVEAGYWMDRGFYFGAKIDPVVLIGIAAYAFLQESTESYESEYPEDYLPESKK